MLFIIYKSCLFDCFRVWRVFFFYVCVLYCFDVFVCHVVCCCLCVLFLWEGVLFVVVLLFVFVCCHAFVFWACLLLLCVVFCVRVCLFVFGLIGLGLFVCLSVC